LNIAGLSIESKEGVFEGMIKIFVQDKEQLHQLGSKIKSIEWNSFGGQV
jgi:guanosine-3',5'-bis(diphosphate) 3'-pyrophosphohydrolase